MKKISYKLTQASNFTYHILAQVDASKEWGAANLFNNAYAGTLKNRIVLNPQEDKLLKRVYDVLSFYCLDTKFQTVEDLLVDISKPESLNELSVYFNMEKLDRKEEQTLCIILNREKEVYQQIWKEKESGYLDRMEIAKSVNSNMIGNYLDYFDSLELGKKMPDKIAVYLIDALGNNGRGLNYGCAVGLPLTQDEARENLVLALHELTHNYTDFLLSSYGYPITVNPTDVENHMRKEYVVDYLLQNYLNKNKVFNKKYNFHINLDLIPLEIKSDPRLTMLDS